MPYGSTDSFCRTGRANAMVLPDPVFALPMQSLPAINEVYHTCSEAKAYLREVEVCMQLGPPLVP